jgi:pimeloyl-ACP methyl ester carboxylesterase
VQARLGKTRRDLEAGKGPLGGALRSVGPDVRAEGGDEFSDPRTWQQGRRDYASVAPLLRELHAAPLPAPDVPVVALVGALGPGREAEGRRTIIATYEKWLASLPHGRLVMAPNSGHMVPQDDEDLVVRVIESLVAEVRRR